MIESLVSAFDGPKVPGAAILVMRDGQVLYSSAWGMANLEDSTPLSTRSGFRLASLTKQFTAMATLMLVKDGTLMLETPITDVLPSFPAYGREIRVRHLLSHTSGVADYEDFIPDSQTTQVSDAGVLSLLREHTTKTYFVPGAAFRYSNSGFSLLASIVERVSGRSFSDFVQQRLFEPNGMKGTVAHVNGVNEVPERAFGYTVRGNSVRRTDQSSTSAVLGDGGVYSSIDDLARWDDALSRGAVVDSTLWQAAITATPLNGGGDAGYGYGWFVDRYKGHRRLRHHGETVGFTNAYQRFVDDGLSVVVLTNRSDGTPWDIAERIADIYLK